MRRPSARTAFLAATAAITVGHVAYRAINVEPALLAVSDLKVGDPVPSLALRPIDGKGPIADRTCVLFVVFNPACPHCHTAATVEAQSPGSKDIPVIWLSLYDVRAAYSFADLVARTSRVAYAPGAKEALKITAVPAAILVGRDRRVRDVWTYSGDESHAAMAAKCR